MKRNGSNKVRVDLDAATARKIIEVVGSQGNPPEYGFQYFTAGLDPYLNAIKEEYLESYIREGGSAFKMVIGAYGGGKTHFLYCIRELAWDYNYLVSYITLSPENAPFHKLELVHAAIVSGLVYRQNPEELFSEYDRGIEAVVKKWYYEEYKKVSDRLGKEAAVRELNSYVSSLGPYESISFRNAVKEALLALNERRDEDFSLIMQWLKGENPPKNMLKDFNIFEKIDKSTAFKMIRSLVQWIRDIGYAGIIVLMDEAEQTPSMSSRQKSLLLNNLRELIDECARPNFRNTLWFYAVPDENFLEGRSQIYEALRQRVATIFDTLDNPTGVKIYLDELPMDPQELLKEVGEKLAQIYEKAYNVTFDRFALQRTIGVVAGEAYKRKMEIGYKRYFVQNIVRAFHRLRRTGQPIKPEDLG